MKKIIYIVLALLIVVVGYSSTAMAEERVMIAETVPPVGTKMTVVKPGGAVLYTPPKAPQVSALESYLASLNEKMSERHKELRKGIRWVSTKVDTLQATADSTLQKVEGVEQSLKDWKNQVEADREALNTQLKSSTDALEKANGALDDNTGALYAAETAIESLKSDNDSLTDTAENFKLLFYAMGGAVVASLLLVALYFVFKGGGKRKKKAHPAEQQSGERTLS